MVRRYVSIARWSLAIQTPLQYASYWLVGLEDKGGTGQGGTGQGSRDQGHCGKIAKPQ